MNPVVISVRAVGIVKPSFNPQTRQFDPPNLTVLGTGFWIKDGPFITCSHVVEQLLKGSIDDVGMLVIGGNKTPYRKASVAIQDFDHDLAILDIEPQGAEDVVALNQEKASGLSLYEGELSIGEQLSYAGFPLGNSLLNETHTPTYAEGVIGNEVNDGRRGVKTIQVSGSVVGGYSGAPIVLRSSPTVVVGVIANSFSTEAGQAGIFRGVHWKHLKQIVELSRS